MATDTKTSTQTQRHGGTMHIYIESLTHRDIDLLMPFIWKMIVVT